MWEKVTAENYFCHLFKRVPQLPKTFHCWSKRRNWTLLASHFCLIRGNGLKHIQKQVHTLNSQQYFIWSKNQCLHQFWDYILVIYCYINNCPQNWVLKAVVHISQFLWTGTSE
jgi:hypothetical protein